MIIFIKKVNFLCTKVKVATLGRQSTQSKSLKRILGTENTVFDLKKREKQW